MKAVSSYLASCRRNSPRQLAPAQVLSFFSHEDLSAVSAFFGGEGFVSHFADASGMGICLDSSKISDQKSEDFNGLSSTICLCS
jgi:hypothetical protein